MATPAATASPRGIAVGVRVLDAVGELFFGARIEFSLPNFPLGVVEQSAGQASIVYPASELLLKITVSGGGAQQSKLYDPSSRSKEVNFQLPARRALQTPPKPVASCPDGKSGQPCVDCMIQGRPVRVCG